jgi:hydrogenase expression/formation protein HypC
VCLKIPARVVSIDGRLAELELPDGTRASADLVLCPEAAVDQYVLVDRGLVLQVIETAEAEALVAMYEEIGQLLDQEDAAWLASLEPPQVKPSVAAE